MNLCKHDQYIKPLHLSNGSNSIAAKRNKLLREFFMCMTL